MSTDHMVPLHDAIFVEKKNGRGNGRWRLDRTIRLGDVLVILAIIAAGLTSYLKMDFRVQKLEEWRVSDTRQLEVINQTLEMRGEAIKVLQSLQELQHQVFLNYPAHRHISSTLVYPPGTGPEGYSDIKPKKPGGGS
jgi:hypothetical protein